MLQLKNDRHPKGTRIEQHQWKLNEEDQTCPVQVYSAHIKVHLGQSAITLKSVQQNIQVRQYEVKIFNEYIQLPTDAQPIKTYLQCMDLTQKSCRLFATRQRTKCRTCTKPSMDFRTYIVQSSVTFQIQKEVNYLSNGSFIFLAINTQDLGFKRGNFLSTNKLTDSLLKKLSS